MAEPVTIDIADLYCVCCAEDLERRLSEDPRLHGVRVDFPKGTLTASGHHGSLSADDLREIVREAGYACGSRHDGAPNEHSAHLGHGVAMAPITQGTTTDRMQYAHQALHAEHALTAPPSHDAHAGHGAGMADPGAAAAMERDIRTRFMVALVLSVPTFLYSPAAENLFGLDLPGPANWIMLATSTPIVFWCGWMFVGGAYYSLKHRALNMNVLIATGVLAAWGFSAGITLFSDGETFFEAAALLVTFVLFGHWMEMKSRRGTTDALRALFDLAPPMATIIRDGREVEVPTAEVVAGDLFVLRPGSKVPVDGVVERGTSSIDESLVTGESVPVEKGPGDAVIGGSVNRGGSLTARATRVGAETTLSQIVAMVERAQSSKAPGQRLADRAAQYLVVLAVGSGIVTFLAWYVLGGETAITALTFAISAVVIACPDALGLATPTAVAVGTGVGARHNILFKDAATLEQTAGLSVAVLDKTGTLTEGRPSVTDIEPAGEWDESSLLRLLAAAERGSEHPLGEAIVGAAGARQITVPEATAFETISGEGVVATVEGHRVVAGNARLFARQGIESEPLRERADALAGRGRTPVLVAIDGQLAAVVGVADPVRPTSAPAIERLRAQGIEPVMLTGDNRATAAAVARELGVERVVAEVLPADKAEQVRAFQQGGARVAMVGDGINDAPALATADVGVAIGAGTDVAVETADIVLLKSDPLDLARSVTLARATVRKMKQNLLWASVYNVLAIPVAAGVLYPSWGIQLRPEWSALLMSLSSIVVATNAVLLKRVEPHLDR